ncbi:MAG: hypothetical protein QXK37_02695 [Candidatus Woesearchaeota archaeon]
MVFHRGPIRSMLIGTAIFVSGYLYHSCKHECPSQQQVKKISFSSLNNDAEPYLDNKAEPRYYVNFAHYTNTRAEAENLCCQNHHKPIYELLPY